METNVVETDSFVILTVKLNIDLFILPRGNKALDHLLGTMAE